MSGGKGRAFAVIRVVLGTLLLFAAGLKIYGWRVSTVPPVGWFSAPVAQAAAIGWEILLGSWLLCGVAPFGSWLAAIGTFTLLAGISGFLGWIGQATCDCFGAIEASPWVAFAVDLAALMILFSVGPYISERARDKGAERGQSRGVVLYFALGCGVMLAVLTGRGAWVYGSPANAWARLQSEPLNVFPEYVHCGSGEPGEKLDGLVRLYNWTNEPVLIYGGTSDCSCVTTSRLPVIIPPNGNKEIPLRLRVRVYASTFV